MGLAVDKTWNNTDRNDQISSTTIAVKNMAVKQTAHGKTSHANSKELLLLTFAWVVGECPE